MSFYEKSPCLERFKKLEFVVFWKSGNPESPKSSISDHKKMVLNVQGFHDFGGGFAFFFPDGYGIGVMTGLL